MTSPSSRPGLADIHQAAGTPHGAGADPARAGRSQQTRQVSPRPLDVYLVEDNVYVQHNLIAALEELAPVHVVGTAADQSVAVDWLCDGSVPCDLVIVDIFLRSGSGLGVLAAVRRQRPQVALVVLSNYATDEMRARCMASGADHVFDKSRDIDLLVHFCTSLAGGEGGGLPH